MRSAESALKYFLFGSMAAAFTLFGLSLLYGISGSANLWEIAARARASLSGSSLDPLLVLAMTMVVVGFAFKVAAAPFHLWAPDAYQGAPTPAAAFIASGSKVAGFFVFGRVMLTGFDGAEGMGEGGWPGSGWVLLLSVLAIASMLLGNLAAIVQGSVRRLLAYSAIAHAGYMLLGIMAQGKSGFGSLFTYALTTLGAFGVVLAVEQKRGGERLEDFADLGREEPVLSACMLVFVLSLAGIPPLAGFFGKFYVFSAALSGPASGPAVLGLVVLALLMSAVSLYYYLQILKQIYVVKGGTRSAAPVYAPLRKAVLIALAISVVVVGCLPELIVRPLLR
jgi:NADH-quinone oxidoreductase subunit N